MLVLDFFFFQLPSRENSSRAHRQMLTHFFFHSYCNQILNNLIHKYYLYAQITLVTA